MKPVMADESLRLQAIIEDPTWRLSHIDWQSQRLTAALSLFDDFEIELTDDELDRRDSWLVALRVGRAFIPQLQIVLPVGATTPELAAGWPGGLPWRVLLSGLRELEPEFIAVRPHWPRVRNGHEQAVFSARARRDPGYLYSVLSGEIDA